MLFVFFLVLSSLFSFPLVLISPILSTDCQQKGRINCPSACHLMPTLCHLFRACSSSPLAILNSPSVSSDSTSVSLRPNTQLLLLLLFFQTKLPQLPLRDSSNWYAAHCIQFNCFYVFLKQIICTNIIYLCIFPCFSCLCQRSSGFHLSSKAFIQYFFSSPEKLQHIIPNLLLLFIFIMIRINTILSPDSWLKWIMMSKAELPFIPSTPEKLLEWDRNYDSAKLCTCQIGFPCYFSCPQVADLCGHHGFMPILVTRSLSDHVIGLNLWVVADVGRRMLVSAA